MAKTTVARGSFTLYASKGLVSIKSTTADDPNGFKAEESVALFKAALDFAKSSGLKLNKWNFRVADVDLSKVDAIGVEEAAKAAKKNLSALLVSFGTQRFPSFFFIVGGAAWEKPEVAATARPRVNPAFVRK